MLVTYHDFLLRAKTRLAMLIEQNNVIRLNIDMTLVSIVRPMLRRLDIAFKPGLSRIQWMSADLKVYMTYVQEVHSHNSMV